MIAWKDQKAEHRELLFSYDLKNSVNYVNVHIQKNVLNGSIHSQYPGLEELLNTLQCIQATEHSVATETMFSRIYIMAREMLKIQFR